MPTAVRKVCSAVISPGQRRWMRCRSGNSVMTALGDPSGIDAGSAATASFGQAKPCWVARLRQALLASFCRLSPPSCRPPVSQEPRQKSAATRCLSGTGPGTDGGAAVRAAGGEAGTPRAPAEQQVLLRWNKQMRGETCSISQPNWRCSRPCTASLALVMSGLGETSPSTVCHRVLRSQPRLFAASRMLISGVREPRTGRRAAHPAQAIAIDRPMCCWCGA